MTDASPPDSAKPCKASLAFRRWTLFCCVVAFAAIVLGETVGGYFPFVLLTPMTPQWAAAGLVGALLITAAGRKPKPSKVRTAAAVAGLLAAVWGGLITFGLIGWRTLPPLSPASIATPRSTLIKIVAANVHTENTDHQALLKLIDEESPDIVVLPEVDDAWAKSLRPLNGRYAVHTVWPDSFGNFGMAFYSRFAGDAAWSVMNVDRAKSGFETPQMDATLQLTDAAGVRRTIRVLGLHPLPPIKPGNTIARDAVIAEAAARAGGGDTPTIVAGDLNATRYCRVMRSLRVAGLRDAAAGLRVSWPNTWSWPLTGIRIDHVLATSHWQLVECHSGRDIGSDHLPVVVTLKLK